VTSSASSPGGSPPREGEPVFLVHIAPPKAVPAHAPTKPAIEISSQEKDRKRHMARATLPCEGPIRRACLSIEEIVAPGLVGLTLSANDSGSAIGSHKDRPVHQLSAHRGDVLSFLWEQALPRPATRTSPRFWLFVPYHFLASPIEASPPS